MTTSDLLKLSLFLTSASSLSHSWTSRDEYGKSLWTDELEAALLRPPQSAGEVTTSEDGESTARVDMLVHCLKDMPTSLPEGCELGAILEREDPVDSLVVKEGLPYKSLDDLPNGSVVGTSSIRRVAQLRRHYPKLQFQDVVSNNLLFISKHIF